MRKIFIDSDYAIDYLRGKPYTETLMDKIRIKELEASLSVVTVFELYTGALLSSDSAKRFEDVEALLGRFQIEPILKETMLISAKIHVDLKKRGLMIGIQDILIASGAISKDMPLLTKNKRHFRNIQGLRLE